MSQSKFRIIKHTQPLYFTINNIVYGYVGALTDDDEVIEYFFKEEEYSLLMQNGNFVLSDFKTGEKMGSGDDVIFFGAPDDTILINHCFNMFNFLNMLVGDDSLEGKISWSVYCENKDFEELVCDEWKKWRDSQ